MAPGWTRELPATTEVHQVGDAVKDEARKHIHSIQQIYIAKTYREDDEPFMLGKMLLIKVDIGISDNFVHMEVFVPSDNPPVLLAIKEKYTDADPLGPLF